jgi:hypothetical protein
MNNIHGCAATQRNEPLYANAIVLNPAKSQLVLVSRQNRQGGVHWKPTDFVMWFPDGSKNRSALCVLLSVMSKADNDHGSTNIMCSPDAGISPYPIV